LLVARGVTRLGSASVPARSNCPAPLGSGTVQCVTIGNSAHDCPDRPRPQYIAAAARVVHMVSPT
jgi:hypothetical protein